MHPTYIKKQNPILRFLLATKELGPTPQFETRGPILATSFRPIHYCWRSQMSSSTSTEDVTVLPPTVKRIM